MERGNQSFTNANDLGVATKEDVYAKRISKAMNKLTPYYEENLLHVNPLKTQGCAFHLCNQEATVNC